MDEKPAGHRYHLLHDYDPVPGLMARGVMSDEHDPDTCEYECCVTPEPTP